MKVGNGPAFRRWAMTHRTIFNNMMRVATMAKIVEKVYVRRDGTESRSATSDADRLEFRFANGKTLVVDPEDFPGDVRAAAMWHGLSQKIGDSFAGADGDPDFAWSNAQAMVEQLNAGDWVTKREGTGGMLAKAIAEVTGNDLAEVARMLQAKTDVEKKELAKHPMVAPTIARMQAEAAAARAERLAKAAGDADTGSLEDLLSADAGDNDE